jgi:hypothetical protein
MAYTFFPESATEIKTTLKKQDKAKVDDIINLFTYLKLKYKTVKAPVNIDPMKISKVNVTRELQPMIDLPKIKRESKISKITIKFGSGSSGGRGVKNKGNLYEGLLADALQKWWNGETITDVSMMNTINDISKLHNLKKCTDLEVKSVGELNNKRPFVYSPKILISSQIPVHDNNLGPVVSDITLICTDKNKKKREIYLSLKSGTTVTFFNSGIRTVLTPQEIKAGKITNENGLKLLKMFNINDALFCDVYNGKVKQAYSEDVWKTMNNQQKTDLKDFLKSGIGKGFTIVHKLTGKTKVYEIDDTYMNEAATPKSCKVFYGGKSGTGKRIDIEIETGHYILKLNMRDTQGGDGYPTRMMCDYSYL